MTKLNKTIWILWLQGWDNTYWLIKQVDQSWEINNPDWKIEYVTLENLRDYVTDIDYIYDTNKKISPPSKSDIIRLSLLKNHGGVWADATMLCMQPLNSWVFDAILPSDFWMYNGNGANMGPNGPASWFIASVKNSYIISKWKNKTDEYWNKNDSITNGFWMDQLFRELYESDQKFKDKWDNVPYLYCELDGQSHTLAFENKMESNRHDIKELLLKSPPYALKFWWNRWNTAFPDINSEQCKNSTGYYAIQLSKRKMECKHIMTLKKK